MQLHHLGGDYDTGWNVLQDEEAPVIIRENLQTTYTIGDEFEPFTATATDNVDGDVDVDISFSDNVSMIHSGGYYINEGTLTVTYYAVDEAGNSATIVDTIVVEGLEYELTGDSVTTSVNDDTDLNELFPLSPSSIKSYSRAEYYADEDFGDNPKFDFTDYPEIFIVGERILINEGDTLKVGRISSVTSRTVEFSESDNMVHLSNTAEWIIWAIVPDAVGGGTGDLNADGAVNVLDVVQLVAYIIYGEALTETQINAVDMNQDGTLNVLDVVQLVNGILTG
jgi:hypothetical protein